MQSGTIGEIYSLGIWSRKQGLRRFYSLEVEIFAAEYQVSE